MQGAGLPNLSDWETPFPLEARVLTTALKTLLFLISNDELPHTPWI